MPYEFTPGNNLVKVTETATNTGSTFKPSTFLGAEITWMAVSTVTPGPDNAVHPYVLIGCSNEVNTTSVSEYHLGKPRRNTAGDAYLTLTYAQAQTALDDVYSAIDAYYTSLLS
jgi:hypothetical protein